LIRRTKLPVIPFSHKFLGSKKRKKKKKKAGKISGLIKARHTFINPNWIIH